MLYDMEDMIRVHLSKLLGERKMRVIDLSRLTGIDQHALAKLYYEKAKGTTFETLNKICEALACQLTKLLEYVPDEQPGETTET